MAPPPDSDSGTETAAIGASAFGPASAKQATVGASRDGDALRDAASKKASRDAPRGGAQQNLKKKKKHQYI